MAKRHAFAVCQAAQQHQVVAVQRERLTGCGVGVAFDAELARDNGLDRVEVKYQLDAANPEGRGLVVLAADQGGGSFKHGGSQFTKE